MRARGAELTDVAILVVAADDGVMPQTVEAINHAQAAKVPIVVAVNKIDKPGANPEKVRGQLTEFGLVPEEYGGDTMFVDISAKQGTNVDKLLEAVLLTADADLDLRANPDMDARGATVEARLDKGRGAVATVLVQQGTLRIGDAIVAGTSYGRVRAMLDENGNHMKEATPSTPVQVLGLTSVPTAGDLFLVASDDRTARQIAEKRQATERAAQLAKRRKIVSLESLKEQFAKSEVDMLNIVIKGDSSGSVEALEDSLMKIEVSDEVGIQVIHRGVGAITQNDVNLATVDKAVIIGFNVRPNRQVADLADREGVEIKYYSIIYKAIEDIEAALKGMLKPEYEEGRHLPLRDPRDLPLLQVRQHRRRHGAGRRGQARYEVPYPAQRRRHGQRPGDLLAASFQGRRAVGQGRLRGRYQPRHFQRHRARRHYRDLRDAGSRAQVRRIYTWAAGAFGCPPLFRGRAQRTIFITVRAPPVFRQ